MNTAVNLQSNLMALNPQDQWNIKSFLGVLKQDFELSFGSDLSQDIEAVLDTMSNKLEENFV